MKRIAISVTLALFTGLLVTAAASAQNTVSIQSNFNGTPIPAGSYVWFNSHLTPTGVAPSGTTIITVTNASLNINGTVYPLPNATITYDGNPPAPFVPSTTYNAATNTWETRVPPNTTGDVFMTGFPIHFPAGLPGGQNPVTFTATFGSNVAGVGGSFQWGAAVYTQMPTDLNQLGVTVTEGGGLHAGVPTNYKQFVIGGARGGGGANYTGSWSATGHFTTHPGTPTPTPTPGQITVQEVPCTAGTTGNLRSVQFIGDRTGLTFQIDGATVVPDAQGFVTVTIGQHAWAALKNGVIIASGQFFLLDCAIATPTPTPFVTPTPPTPTPEPATIILLGSGLLGLGGAAARRFFRDKKGKGTDDQSEAE